MSGIDRRTLLGAAGAGLVLAGCSSKKKHHMDMVGTCALFGQPVTDKGPEVEGDTKTFAPDRICIVYLQFAADGMRVRRTYIDTGGASPTDPAVQTNILNELKRVSEWKDPEDQDTDDIHPIRLKGQRLVVVYVNNDQNYVRFAYKRSTIEEEQAATYPHAIRFTQYSGDDPVNQSRRIRKNHAFFNLTKVPLTDISVDMLSNEAWSLEYWDTDEYGNRIIISDDIDSHYIYSMNIKLEMAVPKREASDPERWVPVIVDPDTGNMGAEP